MNALLVNTVTALVSAAATRMAVRYSWGRGPDLPLDALQKAAWVGDESTIARLAHDPYANAEDFLAGRP